MALCMSILDIAKRLGVDPQRYRNWEKHFGPLPQQQYGAALARILDVDADWLLTGAGPTPAVPLVSSVLATDPFPLPEVPPRIDSAALGQRAKARRCELGIGCTELAERLGTMAATFRSWEAHFPRRRHAELEAAWEDALEVPRGWLRDCRLSALAAATPRKVAAEFSAAGCASVADEIRCVGAWLVRQTPRRRTWDAGRLNEAELRRARIFAERYGVCGPDNVTLQAVGDRYGVTRERVRQVVDLMSERAQDLPLTLTKLSELKSCVAAAVPISVEAFDAQHRDLLGESLSVVDADRFARELLGFGVCEVSAPAFSFSGNAVQSVLVGTADLGNMAVIRDAARRMIRSVGAAQVLYVTGMVAEATAAPVSISDVRRALPFIAGMEWLDEPNGWFWFGVETVNNRVLDVVRRVLVAAEGRVDVEELQQAVCRNRRILYDDERTSPPMIEAPWPVLRDMLARVPWLSVVQGDDFVLADPVAPSEVLSGAELALFDVLQQHGGIAARITLHKALVDTGSMSIPSLSLQLATSPIIRSIGYGMHGLRGWAIAPHVLARELADGGNSRVRQPLEMIAGDPEFDLVLTEYIFRTGGVTFPAGVMRSVPAGAYSLSGVAQGEIQLGTTPSAPSRVGGLIPLLRAAGLSVADVVRVRVYPDERRVEICRIDAGDSPS